MPNWVAHRMFIHGDPTRRREFIDQHVRDETLDFETIVPMPEELRRVESSTTVTLGRLFLREDWMELTKYKAHAEQRGGETPIGTDRDRTLWQRTLDRLDAQWREKTELSLACLEKYGATDWYAWACENWGTKWNASDGSITELAHTTQLMFNTAWSCPAPVFAALSAKWPDLKFQIFAFDEGWCFAAIGLYGIPGESPVMRQIAADDAMYAFVYGRAPEKDDDDEADDESDEETVQ